MKRDMDLIRQILFKLEANPAGEADQVKIDGEDGPEVLEHVHLLHEAGLIRGIQVRSKGPFTHYLNPQLTWEGHNFIEAARSDTTWARAKKTILERGGALTFEVLKAVLADFAKGTIHLS